VSRTPSAEYKWLVLLMTSVGLFMTPLDGTIVSVSLPVIASSLRLDYLTLIWVPAAYLVSFAVLPLTLGRVSDIRGRKPLYIAGFAIFTLFSLLCSTSANGEELVLFRLLQGVGGAFIAAVSTAIVTDTFPSAERGKALGVNAMSVYVGLTVGPSLGGFLTYTIGWRSIFYVNVPIGISLILLALLKLKESSPVDPGRHEKVRFDVAGALLFSSTVVSTLLALTFAEVYGWTNSMILMLLAIALASAATFLFVEARRRPVIERGRGIASRSAQSSPHPVDGGALPNHDGAPGARIEPMLDLSLLTQNRLFAAANLTALLNYTAFFSVNFLVSFYLQRVIGYTTLQAGLILLAMPITQVVLSPVSGWLSDKIGSRVLSSLGMALMCVGMLLLATLPMVSISASAPKEVTLVTEELTTYLFILGFGMGIFSAPNTNAVMSSVERSKFGVASGTLVTMRSLGQSLSVAVTGAILATVASNAVISAFFMGVTTTVTTGTADSLFLAGMREALAVAVVIGAIGVMTSLVRGKQLRPADG